MSRSCLMPMCVVSIISPSTGQILTFLLSLIKLYILIVYGYLTRLLTPIRLSVFFPLGIHLCRRKFNARLPSLESVISFTLKTKASKGVCHFCFGFKRVLVAFYKSSVSLMSIGKHLQTFLPSKRILFKAILPGKYY